jgi:PAS domain-containing protein
MEIELGGLVDALPGLVWTALPDGRAEYIGKGWLEYTGLRVEEAAGHGWTAAVHPEDASRLLAAMESRLIYWTIVSPIPRSHPPGRG